MRRTVLVLLTGLLIGAVLAPVVVSAAATDPGGSLYQPRASQCVLFDTRNTVAGLPIGGGLIRTFPITGDLTGQGGDVGCEVSSEATGYHLNLVALNPAGGGNLKAWPAFQSAPNGGIVNYQALTPNLNNSNAFMVGYSSGGLNVLANGATVHVRGILFGELLEGPTDEISALEARVESLESLLAGVTRLGDEVQFPGNLKATSDVVAFGNMWANYDVTANNDVCASNGNVCLLNGSP